MFLIFDTETTDLYNNLIPQDHPKQARVVQLAAVLLDKDFNELNQFSVLIKPDNWIIQPGAAKAHGIAQEKCEQSGVDIALALELFCSFVLQAKYIIGHNVKFDINLIGAEMFRQGINGVRFDKAICTMLTMTNICKLNNPKRPNSFKWPKLTEAYKHCFGSEFAKAHDALADVKACGAVFKWLIDNKHLTVIS